MSAARQALATWAFPVGAIIFVLAFGLNSMGVAPSFDAVAFWAAIGLTVAGGAANVRVLSASRRTDRISPMAMKSRAATAVIVLLAMSLFLAVTGTHASSTVRVISYAIALMFGATAAAFAIAFASLHSRR